MDLDEAIRNRRSYRAFTSRPVEAEKLNTILEAATWAPSPGNMQPWQFIVIRSSAARLKLYDLSELAREHGRIEVHGFSQIRPLPYITLEEEAAEEIKLSDAIKGYSFEFLKTVPLIIAVTGQPAVPLDSPGPRHRADEGFKYACAAAIQNMLLTAHSLDLGSLWFTFFEQELLRRYLQVEPARKVVALVCIGYVSSVAPAPERSPLDEKVRYFD